MLFKKRNNDFGDPTTNKLLSKGVYNFDKGDYGDDDRGVRLLERNMVVGMWYVFILSILLWWLPVFGQMIAGYLGGRKAGNSIKGLTVTLIPCFIIIMILVSVDVGLLPSLGSIAAIPASMIAGVSSVSPQAGTYITGIYNSLLALMGLNGNGLLIIMVFGLIGGMMADMNKKEVAQATGNSHFYDGVSSFLSGVNIGKFADLVAERVLWTLGTMDSGRKKLFQRAQPGPAVAGFGDMRSLPPPAHDRGPRPRLREWVEPAPNPSFDYDSPHEEEHDLLEGLPSWEPKPPEQARRKRRNPFKEGWGISHTDISEEALLDSWIDQKRSINSGRRKQRKIGNDSGTKKTASEKKSPARRVLKAPPELDEEDFRPEEEIRPKKKGPAGKPQKRDAVVYDSKGEELETVKTPKKKAATGKKAQPALIKRALETQDKISGKKEKTALDPSILEDKTPRPKREKMVQNFDML